ncbi:MBL fold metallo-hydrolase [Ectothiorhodospiraceae bacterium WFHF3C12]|nr:MBL fold metallo-hydrolase [Ectothiorhodospiraceae bacterium WFHF3C12]
MDQPTLMEDRRLSGDTVQIGAYTPVPGFGVLPVNAFLIKADQPVLIDTGLAALREGFLEALAAEIDPADLRWIWLTHTDPDHLGNLAAVLERSPNARLVTTFLGMGKLGLHGLPVDRAYLLNPGQSLDVGDRLLTAVAPPSFDAPETTAVFDGRRRALFSADCFGALMPAPAETAADLPAAGLTEGLQTWAAVDAPWLQWVAEPAFRQRLDDVRALQAEAVYGSHLPPARGMADTLLQTLDASRNAPAFIGPDQADLERMMAQAGVA